MKTTSIFLAILSLVFNFENNCSKAQWFKIPSPWGEGFGDRVVANDSDVYLTNTDHLYISHDGGQSWLDISGAIHAPGQPLLSGATLFMIAGDSAYVYRSTDNGGHWTVGGSDLPGRTIGRLAGNATNLFACGGYNLQRSIYHSVDSGITWNDVGAGLPTDDYLNAIVVCGSSVFIGSSLRIYGVFRSTDSGGTWKSMNVGFPANSTVLSLASIGPVVLAGIGGGVFRSTNNGDSWIATTGMSRFDSVMGFAVQGSKVFVALDQGGVYCSSDSGQTWNESSWYPIATPLTRSIAATNQSVFVGTYLDGLWQRPLSDFEAVTTTKSITNVLSLQPNYPNPISSQTRLSISNLRRQFFDLKIMDVLGKETANIFSGNLDAGDHSFEWNASHVPDGVYFCVVRGESGVVEMPLVVRR